MSVLDGEMIGVRMGWIMYGGLYVVTREADSNTHVNAGRYMPS